MWGGREIAQKSGTQQDQQWLLAVQFLAGLCVCVLGTRSHLGLDRAVSCILGLALNALVWSNALTECY